MAFGSATWLVSYSAPPASAADARANRSGNEMTYRPAALGKLCFGADGG